MRVIFPSHWRLNGGVKFSRRSERCFQTKDIRKKGRHGVPEAKSVRFDGEVFSAWGGPNWIQQEGCLSEFHAQSVGVGWSGAQLVCFVDFSFLVLVGNVTLFVFWCSKTLKFQVDYTTGNQNLFYNLPVVAGSFRFGLLFWATRFGGTKNIVFGCIKTSLWCVVGGAFVFETITWRKSISGEWLLQNTYYVCLSISVTMRFKNGHLFLFVAKPSCILNYVYCNCKYMHRGFFY